MKQTTMGEVCKEKNSESWLSVIWRICNLFMSVFFALATYVQINDPDAGLWMVGYGVPAVLCASIGLNPHVTETLPWRRIADLHVMISTAVVSILGWRLCKERITDIFQEEEGREFSGLMLTLVWLLLCRHSGRSPVGMFRVSTATAITVFPFVAWLYYYINTELRANWPSHCKTAI
ncbi:transmembrane protein 220 [Gymnodraco acuticeps]|uniref:Transmembrane protein 220 n=1 Tax=Gymnodraco acuticeps TaxID=8218 RepID=A0A6P8T2X1_GYMAC|nr:transmembrane protein 220 [Gymnodraco acuticeps]